MANQNNSGLQPQGLSLPQVPQEQSNPQPAQQSRQPKQEARLLIETEDGFIVEVPESKLEDWQKAQEEFKRTGKLNKQQEQFREGLMRRWEEGRFD